MKFGSLGMAVSVGMGFGQYIGWNMGSVQNTGLGMGFIPCPLSFVPNIQGF